MPYIEIEHREKFDPHIEQLTAEINEYNSLPKAGMLAYSITKLWLKTLPERCYWAMALWVGVLVLTVFEIIRRYVFPYEDKKREENGDVF